MENSVYEMIVDNFCADDFYYENVRIDVQRGMFQVVKRDFDLIAFTPKKVVFFANLDNGLGEAEVSLALRASLNCLANKLSASINSFVACGVDDSHYYYFNKFNDRVVVCDKPEEHASGIMDCIENDLLHGPDVFDYDWMLEMHDVLMLSTSASIGSTANEKMKTTADGTVYVYKHGSWREASDIDTEMLYRMTVFGGMFGAHLFYQQKFAKGVLYLLTFGLFGVGWFFDSLEVLLGFYRDSSGRYLVPLQNKMRGVLLLFLGAVLFVVAGGVVAVLLRFLFSTLSEGITPLIDDLLNNLEE